MHELKNISPEEIGTFINKELICLLNNDTPSHGIYHENSDISDIKKIWFRASPQNHIILLSIFQRQIFNYCINNEHDYNIEHIWFDNNYAYMNGNKYNRYSTEEFLEEKFALSTVLDEFGLFKLHLSTFFSSVNFQNDCCSYLNVLNFRQCYSKIKEDTL